MLWVASDPASLTHLKSLRNWPLQLLHILISLSSVSSKCVQLCWCTFMNYDVESSVVDF